MSGQMDAPSPSTGIRGVVVMLAVVASGLVGVFVWQPWTQESAGDGGPSFSAEGSVAPSQNSQSPEGMSSLDGVGQTSPNRDLGASTGTPREAEGIGAVGPGPEAAERALGDVEQPTAAPDEAVASSAVDEALKEQSNALSTAAEGSPSVGELDAVRSAWAHAAQAQAIEFEAMGWTQVGTPSVVATEIVSGSFEGEAGRVEVLACLDSSDVDVVDGAGNSLRNEGTPDRSAHLFTLEFQQGAWTLVSGTFPDDPDC